jgi:hypothetical protein
MREEAHIIEQIKEVLAGVEPGVAIRVIDYFTITHREVLKAQRDAPPRMEDPDGQTAKKPLFLTTEHRIDRAAVLREVERLEALKERG